MVTQTSNGDNVLVISAQLLKNA